MSFNVDPFECCNCGNNTRELFVLPTHIGTLKACGPCLSKYGEKTLAEEADRIMSQWVALHEPHCLMCHEPVLLNLDGSAPVLCASCIYRGREIMREAHATGF